MARPPIPICGSQDALPAFYPIKDVNVSPLDHIKELFRPDWTGHEIIWVVLFGVLMTALGLGLWNHRRRAQQASHPGEIHHLLLAYEARKKICRPQRPSLLPGLLTGLLIVGGLVLVERLLWGRL